MSVAVSIPGAFAPNEAAWNSPENATLDIPGSYAKASLNGFIPLSAGGTFDNAATNSGSTSSATATGSPVGAPELALLFCATGAASGGGRPASPGTPWAFLTNPNDVNTTLYVQSLSGIAPVSAAQNILNGENWCTAIAFFGAKTPGVLPNIIQQRTIVSGSISAGQHILGFNNPTTVGSGILVILSGSETSNPIVTFTVTDNQSNVYTQVFAVTIGFNSGNPFGTSSPTMWAVWAPNIPGGTVTMTSTVTVTNFNSGNGGVSGSIVAFEIGGIATIPIPPHSQILQVTNLNSGVPADNTINGVEVQISGHQSINPGDAVLDVNLLLPGSGRSPIKMGQLALVDGQTIFGSPAELWGFVLTPTIVNDPGFGIQIVASAPGLEVVDFDIYFVNTNIFSSTPQPPKLPPSPPNPPPVPEPQGFDEGKLPIFSGYDESFLEKAGMLTEVTAGGDINYPWLIAISSTMGNMLTNAMFWNPSYYDPEIGYDAVGVNQNWSGAGGREAVGGSTIWW